MKLTFLIVLLFVVSECSFAQDIPDYRSNKENVLRMREKDLRGEITSFTFAGIEEAMGKKPLPSIKPASYDSDEIFFKGNDLVVRIKKAPFVKEKAKLDFYDEKHLVKINKKPFYGSFAQVPVSKIDAVTVLYKNDTIQIPPAAYADLYNPSFTYSDNNGSGKSLNSIYLSPTGRNIYIYLLSRNGKNSYEVTWVIQDGKYLRRVLDYNLF